MTNGDAIENARSAAQAQVMEDAAKAKKCIFCDINLNVNKPLNKKGEFDPEGKDWPLLWVWENPFPQEHHDHHIIIVPKRHINNENFNDEITDEEWLQILDARKWVCKFFGIKGGGAVDRFGIRSLNAGTIGHWHYQLQIPDGTGNVKATFFKDMSPAEQARRANRSVYTDKKLETIDGFAIRNGYGEFLSKDFHWINDPFAHVEKSLPYIFDALFHWKIPNLETVTITSATYDKSSGHTSPTAKIKTTLWGFLAHISNKKAYEQDIVKGYIYQNPDGLFLSHDFSWEKKDSPQNAFVHPGENFRRILVAFQYKNPWVIYDAEISADAKIATITGTLLDSRPA